MPRPDFNDEVVLGHPSRGIVSDIEEKSSLSLLTFESSLGSETDGGFPSYLALIEAGRSPSLSSRGKREVQVPRWKFHLARNTDSHWFLVLASVSGRSQTHWTRKRVLIVWEKRNPGGQNVRSKQTRRWVVMDVRARRSWSRWIQRRFIWFSKRPSGIDQCQRETPKRYRSWGLVELRSEKFRSIYVIIVFYVYIQILIFISHENILNIMQICKFTVQ